MKPAGASIVFDRLGWFAARALLIGLALNVQLPSAALGVSPPDVRTFLPEGSPIPVDGTDGVLWHDLKFLRSESLTEEYGIEHAYLHWDPVTGARRRIDLPRNFSAEAAVATADGVLIHGAMIGPPRAGKGPESQSVIAWLTPQGGVNILPLPLADTRHRLFALSDQSVLIVGMSFIGKSGQSLTFQRVSISNGNPSVERMPDLPGPSRSGVALTALDDGRFMALGGRVEGANGCGACVPDTFLLDPKTKTWSAGPRMTEPRADASATGLADGSVLVSGGWTPSQGSNEGAARTTERWRAGSDRFEPGAPLPVGVAMHRSVWAVGSRRTQLLLVGGTIAPGIGHQGVLALDPAGGDWRTVGEGCTPDHRDRWRLEFGTFVDRGLTYAWCRTLGEGRWTYVPLRLTGAAPAMMQTAAGQALHRTGFAFVDAAPGVPALMLGGLGGSKYEGVPTSAVDAIGSDGRIRALAGLNHARHGARAFALPDGAIVVVGGSGPSSSRGRPDDRDALPVEWTSGLPGEAGMRWRDVKPWLPRDAIFGQMGDGRLVAVTPDRRVELAVMRAAGDTAVTVDRVSLPDLRQSRRSSVNEGGPVVVRGLPGGEIVVAGGAVSRRSIALLKEDSLRDGAVDDYLELGDPEPARRHEIYDPKARTWRLSAPASGRGGPVAILGNGQVVMVTPGRITGGQRSDGSWPTSESLIEISSVDGTSWKRLEAPPRIDLSSARPFVVQGELLLAGAGEMKDGERNGTRSRVLLWFDADAGRWESIWESDAKGDSHDDRGRVIVRQVTGDTRLVVPVEGR